jgi:predicted lipoprotein with Yx(FWY)xxD motif
MNRILFLSAFAFTLGNSSLTFAHDPSVLAPLKEIEIADGRDIVADSNGRVVYTFDLDEKNVSNCYDGCAKTWPPVVVQSADALQEPMGVTVRKNGELQLTIDSKPLYFYRGDQEAGDMLGDGLGNVWHIVED